MGIAIRPGVDGWYLNLEVENSVPVACKITEWNFMLLEHCASCNEETEIVFTLPCKHPMCGPCLQARQTHNCPICRIEIEKRESATRPAHVNEGLRHVYLECPACSEVMAYFAMKVHIFNEHADIRVDAKQPQCRINQEHFKNGPPRPVECQMHGEQVIPMDYDEHVNVRSKQRLQNGALFPRVEGSERRKKIEKEVELLKDIIKKLQERIERLQTPLVTHRQPQLSFQAHLSPSKVPASTNLRTSKQLQPSENFCRL